MREEGRHDVLNRLAAHNIWEGRFVFKKKFILECLAHKRLKNLELHATIVNQILAHKRGYATPGVLYLLDTFTYDGHRLRFHPDFSGRDEQIVFSLIEHLREEYRNPNNRQKDRCLIISHLSFCLRQYQFGLLL